MRDIHSWRKQIIRELKKQWPKTPTTSSPVELCNVELGLYLLSQLNPAIPANALWTLLTGYLFPAPETENWHHKQHQMLGNARHLLPYFKSAYPWERALERYRQLEERLRGYEIDETSQEFRRRAISVCTKRWQVYEKTLTDKLPYKKRTIRWASEGSYRFIDSKYLASVELPPALIFPPPPGHSLKGQSKRSPISVTREQLLATARWMDTKSPASWEQRLSRVQWELFDSDSNLKRATTLTLSGLVNLIGMVSSGKSTLMDVLAVWAAKEGHHVTIVVGSVINTLNRAQEFSKFGISVAPILGKSNRERHTNRLHATVTAQSNAPLANDHIGFRWLSTACPLNELRKTQHPFQMGEQPCLSLRDGKDKTYACPLYAACPFHQAQRSLTEASIWIATPASLIYTRIDPQLNTDNLRFTELVYRRSDLVIIDEADQVQAQLDSMFSPNQTLVSRGTDWLGGLWKRVVPQLDQEGRGQLVAPEVDRWCQAQETVQTAANKIYSLLLQNAALRKSIGRNYFTDWTLFDQLAVELSGTKQKSRYGDLDYKALMDIFREYMDDPIGEMRDSRLSNLAQKTILITNVERVRGELKKWLLEHKKQDVTLTNANLTKLVTKLHFALLVAVLQDRLNLLTRDWKQVEKPLNLEAGSSAIFYSPPDDYVPVIAAAPMGNVLAFQYLPSTDSNSGLGDLRFFRCMGVGRWLVLHLHELFAADGLVGPHVLLLSGTSWAGTSPSYHIQAPVAGLLRAPEAEVAAIAQSKFRFQPFVDDQERPIRVSGRQGNARLTALKQILGQLAKPGALGGNSKLERERKKLPHNRQRILLLVGSYDEAKYVREYLENLRPEWREQILNLVRDDDANESEWMANSLQRGRVHQFYRTGAWLLITPLLAIERGHNILNQERKAAIGAAYFLVRPHPHPTDLGFAIQSINRWAVERHTDAAWLAEKCQNSSPTLAEMAQTFRRAAYRRWRYLLSLPMIYSTLPEQERKAITWSSLVTVWQVIGRLIRGGSPARIYFCDAAFARHSAEKAEQVDKGSTSLLIGMREVLDPYFSSDTSKNKITAKEKALVQALYGPFYKALTSIKGVADGTIP